MPIFLIFIVLWVRYETQKNSRIETEDNQGFLERERQANFTRKADLTDLDYTVVPLDELPFAGSYDEVKSSYSLPEGLSELTKSEIFDCEQKIIALSHKKILNLGHMSNTDIKMEYGVANLQILIQYDENSSKLARLLAKWGKLLYENGEEDAAEKVLTYAVSCKSDIEDVFITLAKIYRNNGNELGISDLVEACQCFDELRRENIINQITSI